MKYNLTFLKSFLFTLLISSSLLGCSRKKIETNLTFETSQLKHSFLASHKYASDNNLSKMSSFRSKISKFGSFPSISNFESTKSAWISSRRSFHLLRPFSLMQGSINNSINFDLPIIETGKINPSYIDYTTATPDGGIIFDEINYPTINTVNLPNWHNANSPDKTLGFQVVEFMLWGEHGNRSHQDFIISNPITNRRRNFVLISGFLLYSELYNDYFTDAFENDILRSEKIDFLSYLLKGIIDFIEIDLAENTLNKPYTSQNIDDELSPFSENTLTEILDKLDAIKLLLDGRDFFDEHNNFFLIDFISMTNSSLATEITNSYADAVSAAESIQLNFDSAINSSAERPKIKNCFDALMQLSNQLRSFATQEGITL